MAKVIFKQGTQAEYDAALAQGKILPNALYYITDTQRNYLGPKMIAVGKPATGDSIGLLSSEDKTKINSLDDAAYKGVIAPGGSLDSNDIPTGAVVKSYVDTAVSASTQSFEVLLSQTGWSATNAQTVENELFFANGYRYTIEPKTDNDDIQITGAEISVTKIADGEMTFTYTGYAPTANILLVIVAEKIKEEEPSEAFFAEVFAIHATGTDDSGNISTSIDPEITFEEVMSIPEDSVPLSIIKLSHEGNTDRYTQVRLGGSSSDGNNRIFGGNSLDTYLFSIEEDGLGSYTVDIDNSLYTV